MNAARPGRGDVVAVAVLLSLAVVAVVAAAVDVTATGWVAGAVRVLTVAAAVAGGGPVTAALLRRAGRPPQQAIEQPDEASEVLRGGAWIGVLERAAMSSTLLAGWPAGVPVVLAVKGLGRYPELRHPGASERFIIGTLASLLWAAAVTGTGMMLL
ncbi:hypothetical protein ACFP6A_13685 [Quadrisphaera sp. GCM10027208]|uniref:hypothetical protein n=1 Tax=Quadrisphaera sp. GCM10027208 TaxID=3273423 RepID=UPI003622BD9C